MTRRQLLPTTAFDEWMANPTGIWGTSFAAQNLWLIDHAQAPGGKAAELSSPKSPKSKRSLNVLATMIESAFPPADRAEHFEAGTALAQRQHARAGSGGGDSGHRRSTLAHKARTNQLLDFVRKPTLITHSLPAIAWDILCQLNLPNPGG